MPIATQSSSFLTEQSRHGGVDLFRRSPRGFVLVDTFDTDASARRYIDTVRVPRSTPTAAGKQCAVSVPPAAS